MSTALCGEHKAPEIFISRLGLGASLTTTKEHEELYEIHSEYLRDISYLPFPLPGSIDNQVTEYLDSGETISQSPRMWAKSLTADDGSSLEVDL